MSQLIAIFWVIFWADIGDKTQLATIFFASSGVVPPMLLFATVTLSLMLSAGLAVMLGNSFQAAMSHLPLKLIAGLGFIAIGIWTLISHFQSAN